MNRPRALFAAGILILAGAALAIRLPRLAVRPMHGDEANQAVKTGELLETGVYKYDPQDNHGPTLYWLALPALQMAGVDRFADSTEAMYRVVPVVFGAGLVLLLLLAADGLSRGSAIFAGVLTAISPAMVFYSRYYIQETLLVFFTFAAIGCGWRLICSRSIGGRIGWALAAGASVGLMHATKETWVLAAAATGIAGVLTLGWSLSRKRLDYPLPTAYCLLPAALGLVAAGLVAVAFYSSFGTNWRGPLDSILAFRTYFQRGTESGIHDHPWHYYLDLLLAYRPGKGFFWTEGFIAALAVVGFVAALGGTSPLGWFLAFYTPVLTAIYCVIPYKTPWCLLSFLHAMILLAGVGAWAIVRRLPGWPLKIAASVLLAAGAAHLGWECRELNFNPRVSTNDRNPWIYAHPSTDVLELAARMEQLAEVSADGNAMVIYVVTPENIWPLPWYLRRFDPHPWSGTDRKTVGYWRDPATWAAQTAKYLPPSVIISTPDALGVVDAHLSAAYNQQMIYGLRPGVFLCVYVREDLWEAFIAEVSRR